MLYRKLGSLPSRHRERAFAPPPVLKTMPALPLQLSSASKQHVGPLFFLQFIVVIPKDSVARRTARNRQPQFRAKLCIARLHSKLAKRILKCISTEHSHAAAVDTDYSMGFRADFVGKVATEGMPQRMSAMELSRERLFMAGCNGCPMSAMENRNSGYTVLLFHATGLFQLRERQKRESRYCRYRDIGNGDRFASTDHELPALRAIRRCEPSPPGRSSDRSHPR